MHQSEVKSSRGPFGQPHKSSLSLTGWVLISWGLVFPFLSILLHATACPRALGLISGTNENVLSPWSMGKWSLCLWWSCILVALGYNEWNSFVDKISLLKFVFLFFFYLFIYLFLIFFQPLLLFIFIDLSMQNTHTGQRDNVSVVQNYKQQS